MIFAPFSWGLFFLVVFTFIWEWSYFTFTGGDPRYWQLQTRLGVIMSTFLGYIVGRMLFRKEILVPGVPDVRKLKTYI